MPGLLDYILGPSPGKTGMLGMDPRAMQAQYLSSALLGLGGGLLSGRNWQQGIGQGLLGANQLTQQGTDNMLRQRALQLEYERTERERQEEEQRTTAYEGMFPQPGRPVGGPGGGPAPARPELLGAMTPGQTQFLRAAGPEAGYSILGEQLFPDKAERFTPNIENIVQGGQEQSGYFDESGNLVMMGQAGPRWAPTQPREAKAVNPVNMISPDGTKRQSFSPYDVTGLDKAMREGWTEYSAGVQATTTEGLFGPDKTATRELQTQINAGESNLGELDNALAALETPPGEWSTGLKGWATENLAGVIEQIPGIGFDVPQALSGNSIADIQAVRTKITSILGRYIPVITNDTSGRYSAKDQALAQTAVRALDPKASSETVKSAFKTILEIEERQVLRDRLSLKGLDLRSEQAIDEYASQYHSRHPELTIDQAVMQAIKDLGGG